jgi:hypothetical protein|tara:strand:- start:63 stop:812 length:750 start_codon:yes stop_codon:yes gene_type:complete
LKIIKKQFDEKLLSVFSETKDRFNKQKNNPKVINNVYLIFQKLLENKNFSGNYVECGVFMGGTLMSAVEFTKQNNINFNFFGVDTFNGFPTVTKHDDNDLPSKFIDLYESKLISKEHFEKAKSRTNNFSDISHLEPPYFKSDFSFLFKFCEKNNVSLIKGKFNETLTNFDNDINILHIDCDLYDSYLNCLDNLYKKVVDGGCVIFDEYYSYKYPGARIAVNEFFMDKKGFFEKYITPDGFERWCFIKEQ